MARHRQPQQEPDQAPRLRCWRDGRGEYHLACNRTGGHQLVEATRRLMLAVEPASVTLPLDPAPRPNPVPYYGVDRTFGILHLARVDTPDEAEVLQVRQKDVTTVELRVGQFVLGEFYEACRLMAQGYNDFSVGTASRLERRLRAHQPGAYIVHCWGGYA